MEMPEGLRDDDPGGLWLVINNKYTIVPKGPRKLDKNTLYAILNDLCDARPMDRDMVSLESFWIVHLGFCFVGVIPGKTMG